MWEQAFRSSRWFTQGWTLQELLVPRIVNFFSCDSMQLGRRYELKVCIHEVTGISFSALAGAPLDNFSIDERLAWSEKRHTTHEEDKAYALPGIFGIFLLPNYGEGAENAFKHLQEEIEKPLCALKEMSIDSPRC